MVWTGSIFRQGKVSTLSHYSLTSLHQRYHKPNCILTQPINNLIKTPHYNHPHPSLHLPPPLGDRSLIDIEDCVLVVVGGWGGSTTSTCLAGCWCSHRPLASCHLWGRREAADTPRGSCSLAHSATESLTHQGGKEGGGRRGDNISIMFAIRFRLVLTQTAVQTPEGVRTKESSRSLQRLGLWFCLPLDSGVHHC